MYARVLFDAVAAAMAAVTAVQGLVQEDPEPILGQLLLLQAYEAGSRAGRLTALSFMAGRPSKPSVLEDPPCC